MHIEPFVIDEYSFIHTESHPALEQQSRHAVRDAKDKAMGVWRTGGWGQCVPGETHLTFSVHDAYGDYFGSWMLYRIKQAGGDSNSVSALLAPMFSDLDSRVISPRMSPTGELMNEGEVADSEARAAIFWRRNFAFMEWQIMNAMPMEDGSDFVVNHWRFPQASDGDPSEQCWVELKPMFDAYSKLDVEWNHHMPGMGVCPVRTLGWKDVDPDPGRARGSVHA